MIQNKIATILTASSRNTLNLKNFLNIFTGFIKIQDRPKVTPFILNKIIINNNKLSFIQKITAKIKKLLFGKYFECSGKILNR